MSVKKVLVAYFSASGVTARTAKLLAEAANADLFKIRPAVPYTGVDLNWWDKKSRSTLEMKDPTARPAISDRISDMDTYDTVFLGFPIWWYEAPRIIATFLESYDFSEKTIIPFATSGGSGFGHTEDILRSLVPDTVKWLPGKLLNKASKETLENWIQEINL